MRAEYAMYVGGWQLPGIRSREPGSARYSFLAHFPLPDSSPCRKSHRHQAVVPALQAASRASLCKQVGDEFNSPPTGMIAQANAGLECSGWS